MFNRKSKSFVLPILALVLMSTAPEYSAVAATVSHHDLELTKAKAIAARAVAAAQKRSLSITIALVDGGGNLVYLERMPGAYVGSVEAAIAKAKASNAFRRTTKVFEDGVASGRTGLLTIPGVVAIEGGAPIVNEGTHIGALGISGAKAAEDGEIATAAL